MEINSNWWLVRHWSWSKLGLLNFKKKNTHNPDDAPLVGSESGAESWGGSNDPLTPAAVDSVVDSVGFEGSPDSGLDEDVGVLAGALFDVSFEVVPVCIEILVFCGDVVIESVALTPFMLANILSS
jgi:hypothetical protein